MRRFSLDRNYAIATGVTIAVIVYGSLYPFDFHVPAGGQGPVLTLLESWADTYSRGDLIANILLYLPLGFFGILATTNAAGWKRLVLVTAFGAALSALMELTQYYDEGRVTNATDVYSNSLGTALGAAAGYIIGVEIRWPLLRGIAANRVPTLLLTAWIAYRLYPYVPTIDLHKYWDTLKPIVLSPRLAPYDFFRHTAIWLTVYTLVATVSRKDRPWLVVPLFAGAVLLAKVLIINTTLSVAETAGAGLAYVIWLMLAGHVRLRLGVVALLFSLTVLAQRLEPFQFQAEAHQFGWIPFLSFMQGSIEVDVMSFLEKFFLYGGWIWLLVTSDLRLRSAASLVAALLFLTSWAETYLPHRSAEITDCVMALVIAGIFALIDQDRPASFTSSQPASRP